MRKVMQINDSIFRMQIFKWRKKNRYVAVTTGVEVREMRISVCLPQIIVISSLLIALGILVQLDPTQTINQYCSFIYIYINVR